MSDVDAFLADQAATTDKLAEAVRARSGADIGLAVHGVPEPGDMSQNLAKGTTYISVTDGNRLRSRAYSTPPVAALPTASARACTPLGLLRAALMEWSAGS